MSRIRDRIRLRHEHAAAGGPDPDRPAPGEAYAAGSRRQETDLSYDLERMRVTADSPWVSTAQRKRDLPFSSVIFRVESLLHRLIVKYVNLLAARQIAFNRAATQVGSGLTQMQTDSAAQLSALKRDLAELRERLASIERARQE